MKRVALCLLCALGFLFGLNPVRALSAPDNGPARRGITKSPYVSALVIDAASGDALFEDNIDAPVYPASVLKLMDLYIVLKEVEAGRLKLDDTVQITQEAADMGGSQVYLDAREQFSVDDLLYALMVQSANDAATALAVHVAGSRAAFIAKMNETAKALGMTRTTFRTEHGLPPSKGQEPDVTTARDLGILCRELVRMPQALKYTSVVSRGFRGDAFTMRNHNHLLGQAGVDGLKTGYYSAAGFSIAATARENDRRVISIVMGSADRRERDGKALELLREGMAKATELAEAPPKEPAVEPEAEPPVEVEATTEPEAGAPTEVAAAPESEPEAPAEVAQNPTAPEPKPVAASASSPATIKAKSGFWGRLFLRLGLGIFAATAVILAAGRFLKARRDAELAHSY